MIVIDKMVGPATEFAQMIRADDVRWNFEVIESTTVQVAEIELRILRCSALLHH